MIFFSVPAFADKVKVTTTRRLLPTMVYVIGTYDTDNNPNFCIVDRGGILETSSPLKYYISIKDTRQTTKNILANKEFTINIPNSKILAQMDYMGQVHADSGDAYFNKAGVTGLNYIEAKDVNAPILEDCNIVYECELAKDDPYTFDDSEYKMYAANVVRTHVNTKIMTDSDAVPGVGNVKIASADIVFFSGAGGDLAGYYSSNATGLERYSTWKEQYSDDDVSYLLTASSSGGGGKGGSGSGGSGSGSGETPTQEKHGNFATVEGGLHFLPAPVMVLGSYTNASKTDHKKTNFATYHRGGLLVTGDATYIGVGIKSGTSWTRDCILSNDGYASIAIPSVKYLPEADLVGRYSGRPLSSDGSFIVTSDAEGYQDKTAAAVTKGRIRIDTTEDAPMINEFPINFICKYDRDIRVADNMTGELMVFKVLKTFVDEDYIYENSSNAKINPIVETDTDTALAYFAHPMHGYFSYGKRLGSPGLSESHFQTTSTATPFVITDENNSAELIFLLTPVGAYDSVEQVMEDNNFVGAISTDLQQYTNPAINKTENYNVGISGVGFSMDVTLQDIPDGKTGIIGINKVAYFTKNNLSETQFKYVKDAFTKADLISGTNWHATDSQDIYGAGLVVKALYTDGTEADITPYISCGAMISGDDTVIFSYGTVLADGELTNKEGAIYEINPLEGGEGLMHDGAADGHIKAAWFIISTIEEPVVIPDSTVESKKSVELDNIKFSADSNIFIQTGDKNSYEIDSSTADSSGKIKFNFSAKLELTGDKVIYKITPTPSSNWVYFSNGKQEISCDPDEVPEITVDVSGFSTGSFNSSASVTPSFSVQGADSGDSTNTTESVSFTIPGASYDDTTAEGPGGSSGGCGIISWPLLALALVKFVKSKN